MENNKIPQLPQNCRMYMIDGKSGQPVGRMEFLVADGQLAMQAEQLEQFFRAQGNDIRIVAGVAPIQPELAEISLKLDKIIEIIGGSNDRDKSAEVSR